MALGLICHWEGTKLVIECETKRGKQIGTYPGLKVIKDIPEEMARVFELIEEPYYETICINPSHKGLHE